MVYRIKFIQMGIAVMVFSTGLFVLKLSGRHEVNSTGKAKLSYLYNILQNKIIELRKRLNEVEYNGASMSKEILELRASLQETLPRNQSVINSALMLPNIFSFLPHLVGQQQGLQPYIQVAPSKNKKAIVAFGIPSISRPRKSYLIDTIQSLLQGLSDDDAEDVRIIVFIGDKLKSTAERRVENLKTKFAEAIRDGIVEIIVPSKHFYPDMRNLPLTFNDPPDRVQWRTKQNLDYSYLMMYAWNKARFYVQLEDDIIATPGYASTIKSFALQQESNDWFILEFSTLGFIGKLFKSSDLPKIVDFILMFYKDKPVDWLLDHILWVKVCHPEKDGKHCQSQKSKLKIRFKPSLFQHVGKESSLRGKRQALVDKDYKNQPIFNAHLNPKAIVKTTIETYQGYTAEAAYLGQSYFWGLTPHAGDVIRFCFKHPVNIVKFKFRSGMTDHPGDILTNASVEVLTVAQKDNSDASRKNVTDVDINITKSKEGLIRDEYKQRDYIQVGKFTAAGVAGNKIPTSIGPIAELRIRVIEHKGENWVALSEIHIAERKSR